MNRKLNAFAVSEWCDNVFSFSRIQPSSFSISGLLLFCLTASVRLNIGENVPCWSPTGIEIH